jgi:hypothetical protein
LVHADAELGEDDVSDYRGAAAAGLPDARTRDSLGPLPVAAPSDHRDMIVELAMKHGWKHGVELGVGSGLLLRRLLAAGIIMVGVDMGRREERVAMQRRIALDYIGTCRMLWMTTAEARPHVLDGWADFIFIDAAHSYRAVEADIRDWLPKVREGGWFGGHDYHPAHPGVMRAVDEAFPKRRLYPHWIWARA